MKRHDKNRIKKNQGKDVKIKIKVEREMKGKDEE